MKYLDLLNSNELVYTEQGRTFLRRDFSGFISLRELRLQKGHPSSMKHNWKARISVDRHDFIKSWDIISPYLFKEIDSFKVVDTLKAEEYIQKHRENICQINKCHEYFLSSECDLKSIRQTVKMLFEILYKHLKHGYLNRLLYYFYYLGNLFNIYLRSRAFLFWHLNNQFVALKGIEANALASAERFSNGMQITIFMEIGSEDIVYSMLKKIEAELEKNFIKPGTIYNTDRTLGKYISIRHPGKKSYYTGTSASSYNPDGLYDPFEVFVVKKKSGVCMDDNGKVRFYSKEELIENNGSSVNFSFGLCNPNGSD